MAHANRIFPSRQPLPLACLVARLQVLGRPIAAIARLWMPGDASRCRLCPKCSATACGTFCLVLTERDVPDRDTPLFRFGDAPATIPYHDGHGGNDGDSALPSHDG
jgi:hypothetical protein